jgi:surface antigen
MFAGVLQVVYSKEDTLQTQRQAWNVFQQCNVVSLVVSTYVVVAALGLNIFERTQRVNIVEAQPTYICSYTDPTSKGTGNSTAVKAAIHPDIHPDVPVNVPTFVDPAVISADQQCTAGEKAKAVQSKGKVLNMPRSRAQQRSTASPFVPTGQIVLTTPATNVVQQASTSSHSAQDRGAIGLSNTFPFGQCTWWADQRYYQLHGIFVPWRMDAFAANWVNRARQFGWHISNAPIVGSIMVLQPGIQGAYSAGHVGVVERLLGNGSVIASSMNWGMNPRMITEYTFHPGPGVAFINRQD